MKPSAAYTALTQARADGLTLALYPGGGTIRVRAPKGRLERWLSVLREHKPAILVLLAAKPELGGWEGAAESRITRP